ncbi:MAG: hypothetical protein KDE15_09420 [Erythrobacter sp.]|nr:hypothetical protein [Erythrobacter sp.]
MIRTLLAMALAASPVATLAQDAAAPPLNLEQRMLLRCSAAFALVAGGQERGEAQALRWPAMGERGREFFVRAAAQVMDQAHLDRDQLAAALQAEADDITASGTLDQVMPPCLALLPEE